MRSDSNSFFTDKQELGMSYLTLFHTILTFNNPEKEAFWKALWVKEKILLTSVFSFSHSVFYSFQQEFLFFS